MANLAPPLRRLFNEIDGRWPHRDRRTDGWYANPRIRTSYGHNPDRNGWVHAIDVDKDGISPNWIIDHIYRGGGVLWYIIWYRHIWSMDHGWRKQEYHGTNPHTDHMHIEIRHTAQARAYRGHWGIWPAGAESFGAAPDVSSEYGKADYLAELKAIGRGVLDAGNHAHGYGGLIKGIRR